MYLPAAILVALLLFTFASCSKNPITQQTVYAVLDINRVFYEQPLDVYMECKDVLKELSLIISKQIGNGSSGIQIPPTTDRNIKSFYTANKALIDGKVELLCRSHCFKREEPKSSFSHVWGLFTRFFDY